MIDFLVAMIPGALGGLVVAVTSHMLSLRKDREERRREMLVRHLIEAYRKLETASGRENVTSAHTEKVESAIADILLLGSKASAEAAFEFARGTASRSGGDVRITLNQLRNDLRDELGLDRHEIDIPIFRIQPHGATK